jgi:hypothetical protein
VSIRWSRARPYLKGFRIYPRNIFSEYGLGAMDNEWGWPWSMNHFYYLVQFAKDAKTTLIYGTLITNNTN